MKINVISGTIETLGESVKDQSGVKTYDYISLRNDDGQDTLARKVRVWDDVDRMLVPGASGTFVFSKLLFLPNELHAVRIGDREAYSEWLQSGLGKVYVQFTVILIIGLLLSFFLIGIPLVILAVVAIVMMPKWKADLIARAKESGFAFKSVKRI